MSNFITDDINISSDNSGRENSGYSDKENPNEYVTCVGGYKKLLLVEIRVSLFVLQLSLKNLLGRQNQQSSCIMRFFCFMPNQQSSQSKEIFYFMACLINIHPEMWRKHFFGEYKKFFQSRLFLFFEMGKFPLEI